MQGFNMDWNKNNGGDHGAQKRFESKNTGHVQILWCTKQRGVAFAIEHGGYLHVASTKGDSMAFFGLLSPKAEKGYYDAQGEWVKTGEQRLLCNCLAMEAGTVYRIKAVTA